MSDLFFLQEIITNPRLPPNKHFLSLLATHTHTKPDKIHEFVADAVHRVFWDDAEQTLANPLLTVQNPRIHSLFLDLRDTIKPLFPNDHPVLIALSAPPPPSTTPLRSAAYTLRDVLDALRTRCAPVRDPDVDALLVRLNPDALSHPDTLPRLFTTTLRETIALAESLKADLQSFVIGHMTEDEIKRTVFIHLKDRQREYVYQLFGGAGTVHSLWAAWLTEHSTDDAIPLSHAQTWHRRLLKALDSNKPVSCLDTEPAEPNYIPPQLLFVQPHLLKAQNYIQAIVITASLCILARRLPSSDFTSRVWALLESEINQDNDPSAHFHLPPQSALELGTTQDEAPPSSTKVINLADEVVRARQLSLPPSVLLSSTEELHLREAVDRTLRATDPVFLLLKKRLFSALESSLLSTFASPQPSPTPGSHNIPHILKTGQAPRGTMGPALWPSFPRSSSSASLPHTSSTPTVHPLKAPGFDDRVLEREIGGVQGRLVDVILWVEAIWGGDILHDLSAPPQDGEV